MQASNWVGVQVGRRASAGRVRACAFALLALLGCGESPSPSSKDDTTPAAGDAVPGATVAAAVGASPSPSVLAEPTWFYRVDLQRDAGGSLSVQAISAVKSLLRPMPGFGGKYWAVAYAGSEVTSAVPLLFPSERTSASVDEAGGFDSATAAVPESTSSAFVEAAGVDRLTITGLDGVHLIDIPREDLPPLAVARRKGAGEPLGVAQQALGLDALRARYPHITFLTAADAVPDGFEGDKVVTPTDAMNDVIARGLAKLTPSLLASVQTFSVMHFPPAVASKLYAQSYGAAVALNEADIMNTDGDDPSTPGSGMVRTIVHEAAHRFWVLVGNAANGGDLSAWPVSVERTAQELVEQYRLMLGIEPVWMALHQTGVEQGIANDYAGDANKSVAPTEQVARSMGFATQAGAKTPAEDFAETAATAAVRPSLRGICHNFTSRDRVEPDIAIPYAKVVLVASLDALSESDFSTCVGSTEFATKRGIDMNGVLFDQDNHAQTIEIDGAPYFAIDGKGPNTYHLLLRLSLPTQTTPPLGLHRLDALTLTRVGESGRSEVLLGNDDERRNRGTAYGLVLVTESSQGATRGAILGLILHNGFGGYTDFVPFGTFNITD